MFGLGIWELLVILLVLVLLFGASRLPQLGSGLGEGIKSFRKAMKDLKDDDKAELPGQEAPRNRAEQASGQKDTAAR